jgi:hypothetical protein
MKPGSTTRALKGPLWEGVLPGVLRDLYIGRRTGRLDLTRGSERRTLRFVGGHIVNADANAREDRMGEVLVRHGLLGSGDLRRAAGFVLRDGKRMGVVLQELGLLDQAGLEAAVELHTREVLAKVFSWNDGEYEFEESEEGDPEEGDVTLRVSTGELILEAARSVQDPDVVRYNLGNLDRVLSLSSDPLLRFQKIALSPTDGYVLSRVDGSLSAREVVQMIPLPTDEVHRSLFALLSTGVIEFLPGPPKPRPAEVAVPKRRRSPTPTPVPPAPPVSSVPEPRPAEVAVPKRRRSPTPTPVPPATPAPPVPEPPREDPMRREIVELSQGLRTMSHFEILRLSPEATEAQVKEAYFRLAKRFHPDVHHDPALSDVRREVGAIFARLAEAYEVLRNPRMRASYQKDLLSRQSAQGSEAPAAVATAPEEAVDVPERLLSAALSLAKERHWEVITLLEPALPRAEGEAKQRCRVLLARAYAKSPNWVKQGEELLLTVVRESPADAEAWFHLAVIYKGQGLTGRALGALQHALALDPSHPEARALWGSLSPEPADGQAEGGLLKRLFRRK